MITLSPPQRLLLAVAFNSAFFFIPTAVAYFQIKGTGLSGFLLLQGLFRVAILVLEVPTGYLADRWNRSSQMLVGSSFFVISMILLYSSTSFYGLLASQIVAALAISLNSGTVQAYLHEALRVSGKEHHQTKWQGRLFATSVATEMIAGLIGGYLFTYWADAPVIATIICGILGVAIIATLPNVPRQETARHHRNPVADLLIVLHHSIRIHPKLPWLLIGPWTLFGLTSMLFWSTQGKLTAIGVSPAALGMFSAAFMGVKTIVALNASIFLKMDRRFLVVGTISFITIGTCLIMTQNQWLIWLGGVMSAGVVHAVGVPLANTLINAEVPDSERATVLSVASMINVLVGAVFMISAPALLAQFGLAVLLLTYLTVTLAVAGYPLWRLAQE